MEGLSKGMAACLLLQVALCSAAKIGAVADSLQQRTPDATAKLQEFSISDSTAHGNEALSISLKNNVKPTATPRTRRTAKITALHESAQEDPIQILSDQVADFPNRIFGSGFDGIRKPGFAPSFGIHLGNLPGTSSGGYQGQPIGGYDNPLQLDLGPLSINPFAGLKVTFYNGRPVFTPSLDLLVTKNKNKFEEFIIPPGHASPYYPSLPPFPSHHPSNHYRYPITSHTNYQHPSPQFSFPNPYYRRTTAVQDATNYKLAPYTGFKPSASVSAFQSAQAYPYSSYPTQNVYNTLRSEHIPSPAYPKKTNVRPDQRLVLPYKYKQASFSSHSQRVPQHGFSQPPVDFYSFARTDPKSINEENHHQVKNDEMPNT